MIINDSNRWFVMELDWWFYLENKRDSPLLSYVACMHKLVVLLMVLNICKSAVLVRSLESNQLHLDMERLRLRPQDLS